MINAKGTENLAKICKKIDATMVYISTDYVFDGTATEPYNPNDKTNPINNYGLTKLEGEAAVRKNLEKYYICRTSWLYGHHGKNFVETMLSLADKPELKVVDDQIGCPTWTVELSNAIVKILDNNSDSDYEPFINTDKRGVAEIIVAKHKNGPVKTIRMLFQSNIAKFKNTLITENF